MKAHAKDMAHLLRNKQVLCVGQYYSFPLCTLSIAINWGSLQDLCPILKSKNVSQVYRSLPLLFPQVDPQFGKR